MSIRLIGCTEESEGQVRTDQVLRGQVRTEKVKTDQIGTVQYIIGQPVTDQVVTVQIMIREGVKNTQRGGALMILKFVTKGRQALPPPKNSYKDMNPPLNMHQQLRSPQNFRVKAWVYLYPP